jgi:SPRY domain-containing SOCS box protein 3
MLGEVKHCWGLSHHGLLWHGGCSIQYTKPFETKRKWNDTTVGLLFDGNASTLTYYKDSTCLGIAFRGLGSVREPLYPIICTTAPNMKFTLVSITREFTDPQDMSRAVILES